MTMTTKVVICLVGCSKRSPTLRKLRKETQKRKKNDNHFTHDVKVHEGTTKGKCVARPVLIGAQVKKTNKIHPLKVKEAMSSVNRFRRSKEENYVGEFFMKNGLHQETKAGRSSNQLVDPKWLRQQFMSVNHESAFSGHLGAEVTILPNFNWPGLHQDVIRFCHSCDVCQGTIKKGKVKKIPLGSMPLLDTPFKRVVGDIVGLIAPRVKQDINTSEP